MDEFEIIRRYFDRSTTGDDVITGIGDDGAVTRTTPRHDLVNVMDTLVEGVHFPDFLDPGDLGYRAVAVNLSDIAAMAATPKWMTLALTLPSAEPAWLEAFAEGLFAAAGEHGVALIGGDTTRGTETVVTVQIIGEVCSGKALLRSGAKEGDAIFVSGTIGDAAAGLAILQSGAARGDDENYLVTRFARPEARVRLGQALANVASAAIDISDGLFTDTEKLLRASGLSGVIEFDQVPMSAPLLSTMTRDEALHSALAGGDDYELCFTTAASAAQVNELAASAGIALTRIGQVARGEGLTCTRGGAAVSFSSAGYRHFGA